MKGVAILLPTLVVSQGYPSDWNVCGCNHDNNHWIFTADDIIKVLNSQSLEESMASLQGVNCPFEPTDFFMSPNYRGYDEMLELVRQGEDNLEARAEIAKMCPAGHLAQFTMCSQRFLIQAAYSEGKDATDALQGAQHYLTAMAQVLSIGADSAHASVGMCLPKSLFMLDGHQVFDYLDRVLDTNNQLRVAQSQDGTLNLDAMLYRQELTRHRGDLPHRERSCLPVKDPQCFPRVTNYPEESCSACCDPLKSADFQCFDDVWTFQRCCQVDFDGLDCTEKFDPETNSNKFDCQLSELVKYQEAGKAAQSINQDIQKAEEELGLANNFLDVADKQFQEKMTAYETLRAKQDELQALSDEASQQVEVSSKDAGSREKLEAELVASETDAADKIAVLAEIESRRLTTCEASESAEALLLETARAVEAAFNEETKCRARLDEALNQLPGTPGVKATATPSSDGISSFFGGIMSFFGMSKPADSDAACAAGDRSCDQSVLIAEHDAATAAYEEAHTAHEAARRESTAAQEEARKATDRCDKVRREYTSQEEASRPWKENVENLKKELSKVSSGSDGARRLAQQRAEELRLTQQDRASAEQGLMEQQQQRGLLEQDAKNAQAKLDDVYNRAAAADENMAAAEAAYNKASEHGSVHQHAIASLPEELFAR